LIHQLNLPKVAASLAGPVPVVDSLIEVGRTIELREIAAAWIMTWYERNIFVSASSESVVYDHEMFLWPFPCAGREGLNLTVGTILRQKRLIQLSNTGVAI